jgi:hypothetical protein
MSNYRYRVHTDRFRLFAGVTAHVLHPDATPDTGDPVGQRVWIDTARVEDGFRGTALSLNADETRWLRFGLRKVARNIESVDPNPHIVVAVQALEIVLADYIEESLAPAIAGWAAQEFDFTPPQVVVRLTQTTPPYAFDWPQSAGP